MVDEAPVLELKGITKRFPGIVANDHVDFDLRASEVHALLGENGAGKSTLMNILYGLYHPDEGEIVVDRRRISMRSPGDAIEHGIGMVHQHFMLIPVMSVAENIVLATEPRHAGILLDYGAAVARVRELSERFGLAVDPEALVENITVGQQQRVEILKALYRGADILILDEPTAVLTPQEAEELFDIIRSLQEQGKSIIPTASRCCGGAGRSRPSRARARRRPGSHASWWGARCSFASTSSRRSRENGYSSSRTCRCATTAGWKRSVVRPSTPGRVRSWGSRAWTETGRRS